MKITKSQLTNYQRRVSRILNGRLSRWKAERVWSKALLSGEYEGLDYVQADQ